MSAPQQQQQQQPNTEEVIEAVFHRLAALRCQNTLKAFEAELQALNLLPPPPAPAATQPPPPAAAAPAAVAPAAAPATETPEATPADTTTGRGYPFEQYPNVEAPDVVQSPKPMTSPPPPAEPVADSAVSTPAEASPVRKAVSPEAPAAAVVPAAESGAADEEEEDDWQGNEDGFLRVAAREQSFVDEEIWEPERGRRPSFSRGAGITAKEHKHYVRDMINLEHSKILKDMGESAPETSPKNAREEEKPAESDVVSEAGDAVADADVPAAAAEAAPYAPPAPPQPVLEKFSLQVIYEKGKTGFEQDREFPVHRDSVIAGRYQILEYIGSAAFSDAVQCLDLKTNHPVCVKIIKNSKDYFDQSLDEIKLLQYINRSGDADENCVLQLYDYFYYKEHLFLVSELLRDNLYEFSKYNRRNGDALYFTLQRLQKMTKQILTALAFIHKLNLIHCDLKPENILIRSFSRCEVKVIDFGSSCFTHDHLCSYVQSRCYRAPEVILGLPYGQTIDIWSLGAILPELLTGNVLFYNDSVNTMLCRIAAICGPFPAHMMKHARHAHKYLTRSGVFFEETKQGIELLFPRRTTLRKRMDNCKDDHFVDFVTQLLQVDPAKRPTAEEALRHPWFDVDYGPLPPL